MDTLQKCVCFVTQNTRLRLAIAAIESAPDGIFSAACLRRP